MVIMLNRIGMPLLTSGGNLETSVVVTGTQKLLNDIGKVGIGLGIGVAVAGLIYCGIRKMMANEHDAPTWNKRMAGVLIGAVIVVVAGGIVTLVTGYYR